MILLAALLLAATAPTPSQSVPRPVEQPALYRAPGHGVTDSRRTEGGASAASLPTPKPSCTLDAFGPIACRPPDALQRFCHEHNAGHARLAFRSDDGSAYIICARGEWRWTPHGWVPVPRWPDASPRP
jgi:hypothetical protein